MNTKKAGSNIENRPSVFGQQQQPHQHSNAPLQQPKPNVQQVQSPPPRQVPEQEEDIDKEPRLAGDGDEEMPATEAQLADDAPWKRIQQNTFTRWANEHLKTVNKNFGDLETDLSDGLRLIALVEVLSGKKLPRHNKRPTFRSQKLENVSVALNFLQEDENIKLVNIDSTDIVDGRLKLILGLIWTLILHYSISMPMWGDEDEGAKDLTPKQRLLRWIQNKIPDLPINNFTSDWNDGRAVGALVDAVAPGLCPDWADWNPKNAKANATEAMKLAEDWLNVPQLVLPEDMINPNVDELSMMTYLSQFPNGRLKPGAPLHGKLAPNRVRAYGPGLEPGNKVGISAKFTVETFSAGAGNVDVQVTGPDGGPVAAGVKFNNDRNKTYSCQYVPKMEGHHRVAVQFAQKDVPKSPFDVDVRGYAGDATKVTAKGPGLEPTGNQIGKTTWFEVFTKGAGEGLVEVIIMDPSGKKDAVMPNVKQTPDGIWRVDYTAKELGLHSVNVFFAGKPIPNSPFGVKIGPVSDARKVRCTGRGLQKNGVRVRDVADFRVYTEGAGEGKLEIKIIGPGGVQEVFDSKKIDTTTTEFKYFPKTPGRYSVIVTYGGQEVPKSPFEVNVGKYITSKVRAFGPGLEGGVVGHSADFSVEMNGETAPLGFSIEGPSQAKIDCKDNGDQTADVKYWPTAPGEYAVHVLCNDEDIPGSPFMAQIMQMPDGVNPDRVKVFGPGVEPEGVQTGRPTEFTIDAREAGKAALHVSVMDQDYNPVNVTVRENGDGTYKCTYTATRSVKHTVQVNYAGVAVPKSPFRVFVQEPTNPGKVRVYGPGVEPGVRTATATHFTVDCAHAGPGDVQIALQNEKGQDVPFKINDNRDGTFTVDYTAPSPGTYKVTVMFAGKEVPASPIKVQVAPHIDVSGIRVEGLEQTVPINSRQQLKILATKPLYHDGMGTPVDVSSTGRAQPISGQPQQPVNVSSSGKRPDEHAPGQQAVPGRPVDVSSAGKGPAGPAGAPQTAQPGTTAPNQQAIPGRPLDVSSAGAPQTAQPGATAPHKNDAKWQPQDNKPVISDSVFGRKTSLSGPAGKPIPANETPAGPQVASLSTVPQGKATPSAPVKPGVAQPGQSSSAPDGKIKSFSLAPTAVPSDSVTASSTGKKPEDKAKVQAAPLLNTPMNVTSGGKGTPNTPMDVTSGGKGVPPGVHGKPHLDVKDVTAEITTASGKVVPVKLTPTPEGDGVLVDFIPTEVGPSQLMVKVAGEAVPNQPQKFTVSPNADVSKVVVEGPGLHKGEVGVPAKFRIDTRKAGVAPVSLNIDGPTECKIDTVDNKDGTIDATYHPTAPGEYSIGVNFDKKNVPQSPFKAQVTPKGGEKPTTDTAGAKPGANMPAGGPGGKTAPDVSKKPGPTEGPGAEGGPKGPGGEKGPDVSGVKVFGPGIEGAFLDSMTEFTVDARSVTRKGEGKVKVIVTSPTGIRTEALVSNKQDGTYVVDYSVFEEGRHTLDITYEGIPVPGSAYKVNAVRGSDHTKCKAYGPGLNGGFTHQSNQFTVETKGAGTGGLALAIEGPSEAKMTCKDNRDGTCLVDYTATEAGDYDITIKFADKHIPGSPFKVHIDNPVDSSRVRAYGPGVEPNKVRANTPANFKIDATKSGRAPVAVDVTSDRGAVAKRPEVYDNGDGTFDVSYLPPPEGANCKVRVTHGGNDIPGSPFQTKVLPTCEPQKVVVSGQGVNKAGVPASLPTEFIVDTREAGYGDLKVNIKGPDGKPVRTQIEDLNDGTYKVRYVPEDLGNYDINVLYGNQPVKGAPFSIKTYPTGDASKVKIVEGVHEQVVINQEYRITVNKTQAGVGNVTCKITSTSGSDQAMSVDIQDNGDGTISLFYTIREAGEHTINVKFGGQPVPGGTFKVKATTEEVITQRTVERTTTRKYRALELKSIPFPAGGGNLNGLVTMPSGKEAEPQLTNNNDGTVTVRFQPTEAGEHALSVKSSGVHLQGSPFKFFVDQVENTGTGNVTAYGPGLTQGAADQNCTFTINTRDAGPGGLSVAVEGPSKADIRCQDNRDGTCTVNYLPVLPGEYKIIVKFADKHINGSPFTAHITGQGNVTQRRHEISVGTTSEVSLMVTETDLRNLEATIKTPSGLEEPCNLKLLPNGHLGISFTPREVGQHQVIVTRHGKPIQGSPFKIQVAEKEVGNASRVKVTGTTLTEGKTNVVNEFTVDTRQAGYGGLQVSVEGPSKADIQCSDNPDGTLKVGYKPTEPGSYTLNVRFADQNVTGSPFNVKVTGEGGLRQTERITHSSQTVTTSHVGTNAELQIKLPGTDPFNMRAEVTSPSGKTEDAEMMDLDDSTYKIKFVPKEQGVHTVSVRHKNQHIPGSPFQFTVGPLKDSGPHRVRAGGPGLERGEVGEPCDFNIWTREAGAGNLSIAVEGPSKAAINFKDHKDGSCFATYKVTQAGEYAVSVKYNDQHIPDSPFKVSVMPSIGEAKKIEVGSMADHNVPTGKPYTFTVDTHSVKGTLSATVTTPAGKEDTCAVTPVDDHKYAVRFLPYENGVYNVNVKFNNVPIRGSPFRVRIGTGEADPAYVVAYGKGLESTSTGEKAEFVVNTLKAGAGTLAATIDGPSKVSMDCSEIDEGYKIRYTPLTPGEYFIAVKYNGYHISGSPFRVTCSGKGRAGSVVEKMQPSQFKQTNSVVVETVTKSETSNKAGGLSSSMHAVHSDASKVSVKGAGSEKAFKNKQNTFTVNAGTAGHNVLMVGVYGQKNPAEEVHVKHSGHDAYQVSYVLKESGEYLLIVKYGDDHIPGSPFLIHCA